MRTSRANWDAPSINYDNLMQGMTDYSYDEMDDLYYEDTEIEAVDQSVEEDDKNVPHDKIPDESDTEREIAENDAAKSDYNKYNIEPEPQAELVTEYFFGKKVDLGMTLNQTGLGILLPRPLD